MLNGGPSLMAVREARLSSPVPASLSISSGTSDLRRSFHISLSRRPSDRPSVRTSVCRGRVVFPPSNRVTCAISGASPQRLRRNGWEEGRVGGREEDGRTDGRTDGRGQSHLSRSGSTERTVQRPEEGNGDSVRGEDVVLRWDWREDARAMERSSTVEFGFDS